MEIKEPTLTPLVCTYDIARLTTQLANATFKESMEQDSSIQHDLKLAVRTCIRMRNVALLHVLIRAVPHDFVFRDTRTIQLAAMGSKEVFMVFVNAVTPLLTTYEPQDHPLVYAVRAGAYDNIEIMARWYQEAISTGLIKAIQPIINAKVKAVELAARRADIRACTLLTSVSTPAHVTYMYLLQAGHVLEACKFITKDCMRVPFPPQEHPLVQACKIGAHDIAERYLGWIKTQQNLIDDKTMKAHAEAKALAIDIAAENGDILMCTNLVQPHTSTPVTDIIRKLIDYGRYEEAKTFCERKDVDFSECTEIILLAAIHLDLLKTILRNKSAQECIEKGNLPEYFRYARMMDVTETSADIKKIREKVKNKTGEETLNILTSLFPSIMQQAREARN